MERLKLKRERLKRRKVRTRHAIRTSIDRPRLVVNTSNRYISSQLIDDVKGVTICSVSTKKDGENCGHNIAGASKLGAAMAEKIKKNNISRVVLDRRGCLYHGKIKAFADAARENGLEF